MLIVSARKNYIPVKKVGNFSIRGPFGGGPTIYASQKTGLLDMAQKAPQKTSEAQPQAAGAGTDISINNIVKLFKEMPTEFKDEIRKELGASGMPENADNLFGTMSLLLHQTTP